MAPRLPLVLAVVALASGAPVLEATHAPHDLAAQDISMFPQPPVAGEVVDFYVHFRGDGPTPQANFTLRVDGAPVGTGTLPSRHAQWTPGWPGHGFTAFLRIPAAWTATEGTHTLRLEVTYAGGADRDPANDAHEEILEVAAQRGCDLPGPDAGGYTCAVTPHAWVDLDSAPAVAGLGGSSLAVPLAGFPFYGIPRAGAVADPKGYLAFTPDWPEAPPQPIPDPAAPNDRIAAFHANLQNAKVRYAPVILDGAPAMVVEWFGWSRSCCSGPPSAAQAQLLADGTVRVALRMADSSHGQPASVGIEGPLGASGVAFHYGEMRLDAVSVTFRPAVLTPP